MNKRILMRVDFQNDFVHSDGALTINQPELIEKHQKFANNLFCSTFDEIIDTYDTHFADTFDNTLEGKQFPLHCVYGTWGWEQAAPFKPELEATKMYKSTTNLWNEENVYEELKGDWKGKDVYLCGVLSDICVVQAMNGLLKKGANVIILEDLCMGIKKQMSDILQKDCYDSLIKEGRLKSITSQQFFRSILLDKKIQHNLVNRSLGE